MDVDNNDIDSQLLQQFSRMGTTDKDVLIGQFQKLLGYQLGTGSCAFFLEMNNWNLQAAVCAYFDFEQPKQDKLPNMRLINDITIGEGESVPPNTQFTKTWRIQNSGDEEWPPGVSLKFLQGDLLGTQTQHMVDSIKPLDTVDVCISMTSPVTPGIYQGQWRMSTAIGQYFGEVIWVIITVEPDGLLGVTQQLSRIGANDFIASTPDKQNNPFSSAVHNNSFSSDCYHGNPAAALLDSSPNYSIIAQQGSPRLLEETSPVRQTAPPVRQALFQSSEFGASSPPHNNGDYDDEGMVT
ncbi:protein ILRUN-like [Tubulanus polymorphus]|uniref:protein ILRUN-like n=1 Tax=Tubulanus polymorphus TaxID=672921 RepID=UPI003DA403BD